jgi:hypothetical protein
MSRCTNDSETQIFFESLASSFFNSLITSLALPPSVRSVSVYLSLLISLCLFLSHPQTRTLFAVSLALSMCVLISLSLSLFVSSSPTLKHTLSVRQSNYQTLSQILYLFIVPLVSSTYLKMNYRDYCLIHFIFFVT